MRYLLILFILFSGLHLNAQIQDAELLTNWVLLTGNQKVYDGPDDNGDYNHTFTWPVGTYTLFSIRKEENMLREYSIPATWVKAATEQFTNEGDILKYILKQPEPEFVNEYEIVVSLKPETDLNGNLISGQIYGLRLWFEAEDEVNTAVQLANGNVEYSSKDAEGNPYKADYPVLYNETFGRFD